MLDGIASGGVRWIHGGRFTPLVVLTVSDTLRHATVAVFLVIIIVIIFVLLIVIVIIFLLLVVIVVILAGFVLVPRNIRKIQGITE